MKHLTTILLALQLGPLVTWGAAPDWNILGNAGTIAPPPQSASGLGYNWMGTTSSGTPTPLELRVNDWRGLRLEPYEAIAGGKTVNIIGGYYMNNVTPGVYSATIGGGGSSSGYNQVQGSYGFVGGGSRNSAGTFPLGGYSTVVGGFGNQASGYISFIGGGNQNLASGTTSTIGGGWTNVASADHATVSGGIDNKATQLYATVGGGARNTASGNSSTAGGGHLNRATSYYTTVAGGQRNLASMDYATVVGGLTNTSSAYAASIGGGVSNVVLSTARYGAIPGGLQGQVESYGQQTHANGQFVRPGDAQGSEYVLRRTIKALNCNNPEELFLDGDTATQRMIMPNDSTWSYEILITARSAKTGLSAGSKVYGLAQCVAGTASLISTPMTTHIYPTTAMPLLIPNVTVTGNKLILQICNDTNDGYRVVAVVHATQVQNP